jgi:CheY-like chemotaxis protein
MPKKFWNKREQIPANKSKREVIGMDPKKVLVVDDSRLARELCGSQLTESGYGVEYAAGAQEAFGIAHAKPIDLVLMDVMMPEISGIEACRRFKADVKLRDIPVVMVTAAEESEHLEEAFQAGAVDYIAKPVRKFELLARLSSCLIIKDHERELVKKNVELEKALSEIKVLRGFIPICAWCKNIRDVSGLWHRMESYIQKHSEASFTHGVCEECAKKQTIA